MKIGCYARFPITDFGTVIMPHQRHAMAETMSSIKRNIIDKGMWRSYTLH